MPQQSLHSACCCRRLTSNYSFTLVAGLLQLLSVKSVEHLELLCSLLGLHNASDLQSIQCKTQIACQLVTAWPDVASNAYSINTHLQLLGPILQQHSRPAFQDIIISCNHPKQQDMGSMDMTGIAGHLLHGCGRCLSEQQQIGSL